jgi:glutamate synthase domain-containing protein 2
MDIFEKLAIGADLCNSARGMMLALGCIQAYRCNSNNCPTGVATQNPSLMAGLDITDKAERVRRFHEKTIEAMADLLAAVGLESTKDVKLQHISCRKDGRILTLDELYRQMAELSPYELQTRAPTQGVPRAPTPPV